MHDQRVAGNALEASVEPAIENTGLGEGPHPHPGAPTQLRLGLRGQQPRYTEQDDDQALSQHESKEQRTPTRVKSLAHLSTRDGLSRTARQTALSPPGDGEAGSQPRCPPQVIRFAGCTAFIGSS